MVGHCTGVEQCRLLVRLRHGSDVCVDNQGGNITKLHRFGCGSTNQQRLTSCYRIFSHGLLEVFQGKTQASL
jgi:hypothetical protein